jgi:peptidoglycan hydrolase-like protein with peptidoglycan-binding domain
MSRSHWAWVESRASLSVAIGGVEKRAGFEQQVPVRPGLLFEVISLTQRLIGFLAASMLVIALVPASALAGSSGSSPATIQNKQQTTRTHDLGAAVQALGSGYSSRHGSGRVRALQQRLVLAGDAPGPIDGRYGPRTEQAVIRFQAAHGLPVDGIAGPVTLAALNRSSVVLSPGTGYSSRHGSGRVRALQHRLVVAGDAPGPIDGRYGPRTERAVTHFQATHGLQVDGIAGAETLARLGRMRDRAISRSRPAGSHQRVNRPARSGRSRRHPTIGRAGRAPAPRTVVPTTHSTRSPSLGLIGLLLAFVVALGLAAMWLAYRRRDQRYGSVDPRANGASRREPADAIATDPGPGAADRAPATHWTRRRAPQATGDQTTIPTPESIPSQTTIPNPESIPSQRTTPNPESIPSQRATPNPESIPSQRTIPDAEAPERAFNLALQLEEDGDQTAAIAAYREADRLGHAAAANTLGVLLEGHGERTAAEACFRRADQRGDANGAFNLAVILEAAGDHTGALSAYQRADRLGLAAAANNLGVLLEGHGERTAAEACFRRADQRGDASGAFNLAVILEAAGDHTGALAGYERADQRGYPEIAEAARAAARALKREVER